MMGESLTWRADAEVFGVALLCAADVAAFLSAANPSIFTMRTFRSNKVSQAERDNTQSDIRLGTVVGGVMSLAAGIGGTMVTRSWVPLVATIAALGMYSTLYEWALANPHDKRGSIADQGTGG